MTKLEGVCEILERCGHPIAIALDTGGASRVADAERWLDRENLEVQSIGWHFNTRKDVTLTPDANGNIAVPAGVVKIDATGSSSYRDIAITGDTLFDLDDNTAVFSGTLVVTYTVAYQFHCVPLPIQKYIVAKAAAEFNSVAGDPRRQRNIERNHASMFGRAKQFNSEGQDDNMLTATDVIVAKGARNGLFGGSRIIRS